MLEISWPQALAWRMRRHEIDPSGHLPVDGVVRRLAGVQAQVASSAELAIRVRSDAVPAGGVADALGRGDLIKTWAMRGTLHLLTPEVAGPTLSLLASGRPWERPSWQRYFGMDPATMERFRDVVIEALDGRTLTREQLIEVVVTKPGMEHLDERLRSGWGVQAGRMAGWALLWATGRQSGHVPATGSGEPALEGHPRPGGRRPKGSHRLSRRVWPIHAERLPQLAVTRGHPREAGQALGSTSSAIG